MSMFPPDLTDPRFRKARVRENQPVGWWRPDDLRATQRGWHRAMPPNGSIGGGN